jgi:hypothetical protein
VISMSLFLRYLMSMILFSSRVFSVSHSVGYSGTHVVFTAKKGAHPLRDGDAPIIYIFFMGRNGP